MIAHGGLAVLEREDTDETLVERVRQGDNGAFEDLYRRHSGIAVSVARRILRSPQDAEDAAAEAFTNVLSALRRQLGPQETFRPYLLACVRNACLERIRRSKLACRRDGSFVDVDVPEDDNVVEGAVAAAAFQSMPARWQSVLWMAEVQQLEPVTIAERLDVNVAAAGALVYRARQGFTEAYLAQHLSRSGQPACVALGPKLAQHVRGTAGPMATRQVQSHIEECPACSSALAELADVNSSLRSLAPPFALISAAGTTAAAVSGGTATGTVSGLGLGWLAKIAAVAALSATPFLVSSEVSKPATGTERASANIAGSTNVKFDTRTTQTGGPHASIRDRAVTDRPPADRTSPRTVKTSTGVTVGGTKDVHDPPVLSAVVPTITTIVPPAVEYGTAVDLDLGEIETALSTLPTPLTVTLPAVTLPTIPAITVPAIPVLPAADVPAISVPPITLHVVPSPVTGATLP